MLKLNYKITKTFAAAAFGATALIVLTTSLTGCGQAQSVYHDGNFTAEQKAAAQAEYQTVEDEESQGSNKKKKPTGKR